MPINFLTYKQEQLAQSKNEALKNGARTGFHIEGQGGFIQFKKDFFERRMKTKGLLHLGFKELSNISDEQIINKVEELFPGKSDIIFAAIGQFGPGMFAFALDQGLACTYDVAGKTIAIRQPRPEDIDIDLINDPNKPEDLILVCTYKKFPIEFLEYEKLNYDLEGPMQAVFRIQQKNGKWGYQTETADTQNTIINRILNGETISDDEIFNENPDVKDLFGSAIPIASDPYRHGNADANTQFKRDVGMVTAAIEKPGDDVAALCLKRLYLLIYYGDLLFKRDGNWQLWREDKNNIPVAAVLCHGARTLMQFPQEMSEDILQWLLGKNPANYRRYSATHGIETLKEKTVIAGSTEKILAESKKSLTEATLDTVYGLTTNTKLQHYGVNVALGGEGQLNELSHNKIKCDGTHGHLYLCYNHPTTADGNLSTHAGLLFGLEQSAPGRDNQYGSRHSILASHFDFTPTGGDDFAKRPKDVDDEYEGLKRYGPNTYYDSLYFDMTPEKFAAIVELEKTFTLDMLAKPGEKLAVKPRMLPPTSPQLNEEIARLEKTKAELEKLKQTRIDLLSQIDEITGNKKELVEDCAQLQRKSAALKKETEEIQIKHEKFIAEQRQLLKHEQNLKDRELIVKDQEQALSQQQQNIAEHTTKLQIRQEELQKGFNDLQQQREAFEKEKQEATAQKKRQDEEIQIKHEKFIAEQQQLLEREQILKDREQIVTVKEQALSQQQQNIAEHTTKLQIRQEELQKGFNDLQQQREAFEKEKQEATAQKKRQDNIYLEGEIVEVSSNGDDNNQKTNAASLPTKNPPKQSFLKKHWGKILIGALIGSGLVVAGVFSAGLVPLIAASLGISFLAAAGIGFGGAALLGAVLGSSAGVIAGAMPTKKDQGVGSFFKRHKGKIIIAGLIVGLIVAGIFTGGILSLAGVIAGVGFLGAIAAGVGGGVAASVGVSATVTTAVAGAAIVTAGAATVGTTSGMLLGALADTRKEKNIQEPNEPIPDGIPDRVPDIRGEGIPFNKPPTEKKSRFWSLFQLPIFKKKKSPGPDIIIHEANKPKVW